jgi:HSP20 family protein
LITDDLTKKEVLLEMTRQQSKSREESQAIEPRRRSQTPQQLESWFPLSPFSMMRRFADDMDRMFEGFGMTGRTSRLSSWMETGQYIPQVDIFERGGKLVVRADLPGMTKDDVNVEITADSIRIEGERKYEHEANEEGVYRSERSYGRFVREIPLPEGVKTDNATAKFNNGVLEITVDAPQTSKNRRKIQIQEESGSAGKSAA